MNTKQLDSEYIASTYGRFDVALSHGKGSIVWDEDGKEYIDLGSGIAVNTFGYCDGEWLAAVTAQASTLSHTSNLYYTSPCAKLAQMLCEKSGMKKVFFGNSGAEANECAIKTARKYSYDKYGEGRNKIITLINSFHGRTVTTLSATGQDSFHTVFMPFTEGFAYVPANDIAALSDMINKGGVCAVMMEMIQGEGGVVPLSKDYVNKAAALCAENDILLIADEVQTGNGRSGKLFCWQNFGITPDIVSTAKGLAGGLPFSATLMGEKTAGVLTPGSHGSTFGGNPVCAAAALSVLSRIDEECLAGVRERSEYIVNSLKNADGVISVTGMGLMLGIECKVPSKTIAVKCLEKGVLVLTAKNKVRLLPALNIPFGELEKAIEILKEVIANETSSETR